MVEGPSGRTINVDCEEFARIYLEDKSSRVRRLFEKHSQVTLAEDDKELTYYRERKYYLMNGIQAVLAFQAYAVLARQNVPLSDWGSKSLALDTRTQYVRTITKIQICRVIYRNREAMARLSPSHDEKAFFDELNVYANETATRLNNSLALLQRILSADKRRFAEKFERRCGEMVDFVKGHWKEVEGWQIPSLPDEALILSELGDFTEHVIVVVMNSFGAQST